MNLFKVPSFDQNLLYNGTLLTDSAKTLGQLRVLPDSLIYLRVDEVPSGAIGAAAGNGVGAAAKGEEEETVPEEGFKGTGLLGGPWVKEDNNTT